MLSLHNLLIKHFVCQNYDRGLNKPVYLIKPFLQFGYCNMYDITQFLLFFNLVAFYVVFDIPFNTCSPGRQRFEIAICCPQGNGSLRIVSLNSHHVVPKLPESEGCPKVLTKLTQNYCVTRAPLLYFIWSWVALSFKVCESVSEWVRHRYHLNLIVSSLILWDNF